MVLSWYGENRMNRREMGQWRSADQGGGGLARYAIFVAMQRAASHTVPAAWRIGALRNACSNVACRIAYRACCVAYGHPPSPCLCF